MKDNVANSTVMKIAYQLGREYINNEVGFLFQILDGQTKTQPTDNSNKAKPEEVKKLQDLSRKLTASQNALDRAENNKPKDSFRTALKTAKAEFVAQQK